jgi:hypothetical protein
MAHIEFEESKYDYLDRHSCDCLDDCEYMQDAIYALVMGWC